MELFVKRERSELSEEVKSEKPSLIGMIMSPGEQFERIRERPLIWGALAIVTLLFIIAAYLQTLGIEIPGMEELSAEEAALVRTFSNVGVVITALFTPVIIILISSAIYLLIAKIARSDVKFKQLFSMNTYITFIGAIGGILNGILFAVFGGGEGTYFTSLGSLIEVGGAMQGLLDSLEIFSIWNVILTAIGLEKVARLSKGVAWTVSIVLFVIGVLFAMFGAAVSGMVGM